MKPIVVLPLAGFLALGTCSAQTSSITPTTTPAVAAPSATPAVEGPRAPIANTLMDGTAVPLRLSDTLSSEDAHVGQKVSFEVTEDTIIQGVTIIPKGSPAVGP